MAALLVRLITYCLVVFGARTLWQQRRERILLALRVAVLGWAVLFGVRLLLVEHDPDRVLAAVAVIAGLGALWGVLWVVLRVRGGWRPGRRR